MSISVLNTDANLSGKTLVAAENDDTVTGLKTFSRGAAVPFAVATGALNVSNLDADKVDGKHATDLVLVSGTQAMTGKLDLGTIGQIQFPATQDASADANTLDDYEEGTWTPVLGGAGGTSGQTYVGQIGRYVKIGRLVLAQFRIELSAKGTITGNVQIQGLPFASDSATSLPSVSLLRFDTLAVAKISVHARITAGVSVAALEGFGAAAVSNDSALTTTDIANGTILEGTLIYRAGA